MTRATKRAAVIVAHPCDDSLTTAAANAAGGGLVAAGFDVTTIDLYAIGFDAVKHLLLCRVERRPPRLDMAIYPYLPRARVETTSARSYMRLLTGGAAA